MQFFSFDRFIVEDNIWESDTADMNVAGGEMIRHRTLVIDDILWSIGGFSTFDTTAYKYSLTGGWEPDPVDIGISFGDGVIVSFNQ